MIIFANPNFWSYHNKVFYTEVVKTFSTAYGSAFFILCLLKSKKPIILISQNYRFFRLPCCKILMKVAFHFQLARSSSLYQV
jgi:hypothetical protein